ncbi:BAH_G0003450.mRNA.1.CDS.1 [Saccharomyces cerevisiae]|nr:Rib7p [Saccharomyces cerevisiae YJM1418]CAD6599778.1 SX2_G0015610.mRNA.1.CDS.1 [Saccharomyces cerevisiae]CAI4265608.1 BAK_1a_G0003410.mRNA.1.CDS.1 [Saccharomyces cerevisiae]CAI4268814.1 BAH_G0003450.mRNA.1.CDS.1 [Saccharomyces cerevisiae]CAI4269093.1 BAG_1a_G0003450.mRNA.1.CDS.1 [Saccharomyces cerevisiae]
MSLTPLCEDLPQFLQNYLPNAGQKENTIVPFVTLTYAQSLDARVSRGPGVRTIISHPETKTMTHYLRHHHDGILVGSGTVLADNPGLNCKWGPDPAANSPRPIIIDTKQKWRFDGSKIQELFIKRQGKPPIVVVTSEPIIKEQHVDYAICPINDTTKLVDWKKLFEILKEEFNIRSVMVEGGANVINQLLLRSDIVNSLIITIGSTFLGSSGTEVSPPQTVNLKDMSWWKGITDVVLCARLADD